MDLKKYRGAFTALITPFKKGKVDFNAFEKMINFQIAGKIDGLVPCGSTGEGMCLTNEEHFALIEASVSIVNHRVPIIAGIGSNDTLKSVEYAKYAEKIGVDAIMAVVPYYNRPPQRGIIEHFKTIAEAVKIPVLLYNVPARTASDIELATIMELATTSNIFGIKDASGDLSRVKKYQNNIGKKFIQFCGEDSLVTKYYQDGGDGVISVISNIIPTSWAEIFTLSSTSKIKAEEEFNKSKDLLKSLSCETNPIPIKYALHRMGYCEDEYRLPLVPLLRENRKLIDAELQKLGLI